MFEGLSDEAEQTTQEIRVKGCLKLCLINQLLFLSINSNKKQQMSNQFYKSSTFKYRESSEPDHLATPNVRFNYHNNNQEAEVQQVVDIKIYTQNNYKFIKNSPLKNNDFLPPKAAPFQRSKKVNNRETSFKDRSSSNVSNLAKQKEGDQIKDSRNRADSVSRVTDLKKRISQQMAEKQKWKDSSEANAQKVSKMSHELTKSKQSNKWYQEEMDRINKINYETENELRKANQTIEHLQKIINNNAIQINSIKQKDSELEHLKNQIKSLTFEIESLTKTISAMKTQIQKKSLYNFQEECVKKSQTIVLLQREIDKLHEQLEERKQSEKMMEANLRATERVLYQKEGELKKIAIHLNFLGRKQAMSIDDVRSRKDLQIKIMRDKYNKATKDLKQLRQSKDKDEKVEKKKVSKQKDGIRKIKSQKHLRMTTESDEFTFELSSET